MHFENFVGFLKKNTRKSPRNFGYSREDIGQAMSWGRSLANSSPTFPARLPESEPDSCLGRKLLLSQLYYLSLQQNFSLGDLHNKLGFRNYFYFCVSKSNRIKN